MGTHDPAAAERAGIALEVGFAEGEAAEDALGLGLHFPAAVFVHMAGRELQNGHVVNRSAFLGEEAEGDAAFHHHATVVRRGILKQEGEERRFTGSIRADEADFFAPVDVKRHLAEQSAAGEGFADIGNGEHGKRGGHSAFDSPGVEQARRCVPNRCRFRRLRSCRLIGRPGWQQLGQAGHGPRCGGGGEKLMLSMRVTIFEIGLRFVLQS